MLGKIVLASALCLIAAVPCLAAEFRGAWVTSWDSGFFTKEECDATVDAAKKAGLNALLVEVRKCADAYYQSQLEPVGPEVPEGFDPLEYIINKAHAEGIQVHAWMVVYRVWHSKNPPADPKHVLAAHPEWANISYDGNNVGGEGNYIDPGIPEYREHFTSVCEDIVKRYKVDGIHYDYVRYPDKAWGYSDIALKRYYEETGATEKPTTDDPKWLDWKRDQVTALVKMVHDRVKAINPKVMISASTIPWGDCPEDWTKSTPYDNVCQDWRKWMEEGLIDANCPMVYRPERNEWGARSYRGWVDGAKRWSYGRQVFIGTDANGNPPEDMLKQIGAVRKAGLQGFLLFSFNPRGRDNKVGGLAKSLYPAPKLPVIQATGNNAKAAREAFDKGIELATKNQLTQAITQFKKATELDPGYAEALFRLGRCYTREHKPAEAKKYYVKVLALDPLHEGAHKELKALGKRK